MCTGTILRKHSELVFNPDIYKKRGVDIAHITKGPRTAAASRHYQRLSTKLYNLANKKLNIYHVILN